MNHGRRERVQGQDRKLSTGSESEGKTSAGGRLLSLALSSPLSSVPTFCLSRLVPNNDDSYVYTPPRRRVRLAADYETRNSFSAAHDRR